MAGTRTHPHICVYFEDGGFEPLCVCGERAVLVVDQDNGEAYLVGLDAEPSARARRSESPDGAREVLALSA